MRSDKSHSAPLSCNASSGVKPPMPPLPSMPSSLWYSQELDLPKYVLATSRQDMAMSMSASFCLTSAIMVFCWIAVSIYFLFLSPPPREREGGWLRKVGQFVYELLDVVEQLWIAVRVASLIVADGPYQLLLIFCQFDCFFSFSHRSCLFNLTPQSYYEFSY